MGSNNMEYCYDTEAMLGSSETSTSDSTNDSVIADNQYHDRHSNDDDQMIDDQHYEYSEAEVEWFLWESYNNLVNAEPNDIEAAMIDEEQKLEVERFLSEAYINIDSLQSNHASEEVENQEIMEIFIPHSNHKRGISAQVESLQPMAAKKRKMKTFKISAHSLHIGTLKRGAINQEDVVAKCYYAKKRIIWELLENGLKKKIEMHWDDISAMRVAETKDGKISLEIELKKPPLFFQEIEMTPGQHTKWKTATDFTGGNALINRIHSIQFCPGVFYEPYEELLDFDPRFKAMSQAPFPTPGVSPFFGDHIVGNHTSACCNCERNEPLSNQQLDEKSLATALPNDFKATSSYRNNGPKRAPNTNTALWIQQTGISSYDQYIVHENFSLIEHESQFVYQPCEQTDQYSQNLAALATTSSRENDQIDQIEPERLRRMDNRMSQLLHEPFCIQCQSSETPSGDGRNAFHEIPTDYESLDWRQANGQTAAIDQTSQWKSSETPSRDGRNAFHQIPSLMGYESVAVSRQANGDSVAATDQTSQWQNWDHQALRATTSHDNGQINENTADGHFRLMDNDQLLEYTFGDDDDVLKVLLDSFA